MTLTTPTEILQAIGFPAPDKADDIFWDGGDQDISIQEQLLALLRLTEVYRWLSEAWPVVYAKARSIHASSTDGYHFEWQWREPAEVYGEAILHTSTRRHRVLPSVEVREDSPALSLHIFRERRTPHPSLFSVRYESEVIDDLYTRLPWEGTDWKRELSPWLQPLSHILEHPSVIVYRHWRETHLPSHDPSAETLTYISPDFPQPQS